MDNNMNDNKIKRPKYQRITPVLLIIGAVILIIFSLYDFIHGAENLVSERAEQTLMDTGNQSARLIEAQINRDFNFLSALSAIIVEDGNVEDQGTIEKKLQVSVKQYSFDRMAFVLADGTVYSDEGKAPDLMKCDYIKEAFTGKKVVSNVVISKFTGHNAVILVVPIYKNDQVIGVIQGSYDETHFLTNVVDYSNYGGKGSTYVVRANGDEIIVPEGKAIASPDKLSLSEEEKKRIETDISKHESGFSVFKVNGENMCFSYAPTNINDWYVITVVPEKEIMGQMETIRQMLYSMCAKIVLVFLCIGFYIFMAQRKTYRLNIERKNAKRLDDERYQILLENLNAVIFEWDLEEDTLTCSKEWEERLGYIPTSDMFKRGVIVTEEERLSLEGFFEMIKGPEVDFGEEEYRFVLGDWSEMWCRLRMGSIRDQSGKTKRIMGIVEDIDDQKKREYDLLNRARCDSLTNLYNKKTTEEQIGFAIYNNKRSGTQNGILLLDIDDFKQVNDQLGHGVGDEVLIEVASKLETLFREPDIKGRIGGDEFMIMLRNIQSADKLKKRGEAIVEAFKEIEVAGKHGITCSVGIVVAPEDGEDFETLYKHADEAMYFAKGKGKNTFAFYSDINKVKD
ncbi:MAG: diguanylate cyclase [Eubacterium sp.]